MDTSIVTVSLSGGLAEKLEAIAAAGFTGVNIEFRAPVTEGDRLDRVSAPAGAEGVDATTAAIAAAVNAHADKLNARLFSSMDYAVIARR